MVLSSRFCRITLLYNEVSKVAYIFFKAHELGELGLEICI